MDRSHERREAMSGAMSSPPRERAVLDNVAQRPLNDQLPEEQAPLPQSATRLIAARRPIPGPLTGRASLDIRSVNSSILERNSLRIGEVFALL